MDHQTPRVVVTGLGVVSSLGIGVDAFWKALIEGKSGVSDIGLFDTSDLERHRGGEVKGFRPRQYLSAAEAKRMGRASAMAVTAAKLAVEHAGISAAEISGPQTAVIMGTTMGEADIISELQNAWIHGGDAAIHAAKLPRYGTTLVPIHVARALGATGMAQVLPAACAAGNYAIGFAADQIRAGRAEIAVTGATELIDKLQYSGFVRLGAVSPDRCQPFDKNRQGLVVGEGAGVLVVESEEHAKRRGAKILAEIGGYGLACDAHHITRPHPEGKGSASAIRAAIKSSRITADQVDFVNAHGTGTASNDPVEARVMNAIFEGRAVPTTSIKSMIGHCMGAASAIEAVSCVKTVETGIYPPTIGYETPDPECDLEIVANEARQGPSDIVLNNALAFGGYDAALIFARPGVLPANTGTDT